MRIKKIEGWMVTLLQPDRLFRPSSSSYIFPGRSFQDIPDLFLLFPAVSLIPVFLFLFYLFPFRSVFSG